MRIGLSLVLVLLLGACSSGSDDTNSDTPSGGTTTTTLIQGSVGDGPITNADVTIIDASGATIATGSSGSTASYAIQIPADADYPLTIEAAGGIDLSTGAAPDFTLRTVANSSATATANVSPLSTLVAEAALCADNMSDQGINLMADRIDDLLGLGTTTRQVMYADVGDSNVADFVLFNEILGEALRRSSSALAGSDPASEFNILQNLACDMGDGSLDGQMTGGAMSARRTATFMGALLATTVETLNGALQVNGQDVMPVLEDAIRTTTGSNSFASIYASASNSELIDTARTLVIAFQQRDSSDLLQELVTALQAASSSDVGDRLAAILDAGALNDLAGLAESVALSENADVQGLLNAHDDALNTQPPGLSLFADPNSVDVGGSSTISWISAGSNSCEASGAWGGSRPTEGTFATGSLQTGATFELVCFGAGGSVSGSVSVAVSTTDPDPDPDPDPQPEPEPTVSLAVNPTAIQSGEAATLSWSSTNATGCSASGSWSGSKAVAGEESTGSLSANASYTLTCTGPGGSASDTVSVTISQQPLPQITLSATPTTVSSGATTTLNWSTENAQSCAATDGWSGVKETSGSEVSPTLNTSTTFGLQCTGPGGTQSASVFVSVTGQPSGSTITSFDVVDSGSGSGRLVTLGVPLGEGTVPAGSSLVVVQDGNVLPSQWNALTTWRTDGSQLHGALTFEHAGTGSATYTIQVGSPAGGTTISKADVTASNFDAEINVNVGGSNYSLSARDLLDGTVPGRQDHTHFSGPLASEFVVGGALRLNGSGSEHNNLQGYFHVRAFGRPVDRVYVTMVVENTGVFRTLSGVVGDVTLSVGGNTVYTHDALEIDGDKRFPKRFWWNGDPGLWVRHDVEHVQSTKLMPEYRELQMSESTLNGFPSSIEWGARGQLNAAMDGGGSQRHIAPFDSWSAAYMISGDRRAYDAMRAHDDAYHWVTTSHGYAMNTRDENTGFPLDMANHQNVVGASWGNSGGAEPMAARQTSSSPLKTDMAHEPANGYVVYLLTAEFGAMESAQLWGVSAWTRERPGSYPGWPRSFYVGQVRAVGWGLRNVINAAVITPDTHPLKNTLDDAVVFALASLNDDARPLDTGDAIGLLLTGPGISTGIHRTDGDGERTGTSPWMQDYLTWAIGSAYERGYRNELDSSGLWTWRSQAVVERLGDGTRYCWASGAQYNLKMLDNDSSPIYTDWATIYTKNFGVRTCPEVGTDDAGSDRNSTDYGAQMGPAAAVAADTGRAGAIEAWNRYDSRVYNWSRDFDERPEWAIKRRD